MLFVLRGFMGGMRRDHIIHELFATPQRHNGTPPKNCNYMCRKCNYVAYRRKHDDTLRFPFNFRVPGTRLITLSTKIIHFNTFSKSLRLK